MFEIRSAIGADQPAIDRVQRSAFGEQGEEIVKLVNDLNADATAHPLLSLVAETGGRLVGHVLFTPARLEPEDQPLSIRLLAPLAVSSEFQSEGVGSRLVREGLRRLTESGVDLVFVLGHPGYYPKFGFRTAGTAGFAAPHPIPPEHANAWMVLELRPGIIGTSKGTIRCAEVLSDPLHWRE